MVVRILIASLLSAVVMMAWNSFFWMESGVPMAVMQGVPNEEQVLAAVGEHIDESGMYFFPWPKMTGDAEVDKAAKEAFHEKQAEGPLLQIVYQKDGMGNMAVMMSLGFAQYFVLSLLGAMLLSCAGCCQKFSHRWGFVALLGVAVALVDVTPAIWFHHPWSFALMLAGSSVCSWLLAGLVLAAIVRPRPVTTA